MIDPELLPEFVAEASEHLDEMEVNLIKLETDPGNKEILNEIFRDVHTIKGSSAYLGLKITSELAHKLENLLEIVRQGKREADSSLIDILIAAKDRLTALVADIEKSQEEQTQTDDLIEAIHHCLDTPEEVRKKVASTPQGADHTLPRQDTTPPPSSDASFSLSEEEFQRNLGNLFESEDKQSHAPPHPQESTHDMPPALVDLIEPALAQIPSPSETISETGQVKFSYDETEDQELFAIYIEQLQLNLTDIQELAIQLSAAENGAEVLSKIKERIQRLDASANYMGYDKLVELCTDWQARVTALQDRLFLDDAPSSSILIEEGINTYLDIIKQHFPQLQNIARVPLVEETLELDLDSFFATEEQPSSDQTTSTESELTAPAELTPELAATVPPQDDRDHPEFDNAYDEAEDQELFSIYIEQLQLNVSDIQNLAAQLSTSKNCSDVLGSIKDKIQRLDASANYMGYDKLVELCTDWQAKLETFQQSSLLRNEGPSCSALIEEGINAYLDKIQQHFPQLQNIERIAAAAKPVASAPSLANEVPPSATNNTQGSSPQAAADYEEHNDTELFAIFLEQLKDNLQAVRTLAQQIITSETPSEIVKTLTEKISRIRAAANYMGYEQLTLLYDAWVEELDAFRFSPHVKNGRELSPLIHRCLSTYTEKIFTIFPQIKEEEPAPCDKTLEQTKEQAPPALQPSKNDTVLQDMPEEGLLLIDRTDELFSAQDPFAENEQEDINQLLINQLSSALDSALGTGPQDKQESPPDKQEHRAVQQESSQAREPSFHIPQDKTEDLTVSLASVTPLEPTAVDAQKDIPAQQHEAAAEPKLVERRKEDRRKEERRASPEGGGDKVFRQSLRIDANKIDELMNQAGELVINRAWFSQLFNEMRSLETHLQSVPELDKRDIKQVKNFSFKFHEAIVALGRVANELQEGVMKVRMLPISQLFNRYPRLIRDLVHESDKDIQLVLRGADTELDKMIIEEIADPLIHIIRNAVDHGIEPATTRKAMGKPEKGLLKLDAYHEGSHVVIEVIDDGRGIDLEAVTATALQKELVTRDQLSRMSPKEITELIMHPGFSTATQVTRTSGRGVGMDVVRKNLENLNGTIEIDSQVGKGTSIRIKIPLTLAVIKALLVKVRDALFTIPLIAVDETLQVRSQEIHSIKGNEVIYLRDSTIPLIRLSAIFNLSRHTPATTEQGKTYVVIVSAGNNRVGLVVDALRGQEEVVIKPLPDYLRDNQGFSGATILGDGRISLILDIHELVNLTIGRQSRRQSESSRMISETL